MILVEVNVTIFVDMVFGLFVDTVVDAVVGAVVAAVAIPSTQIIIPALTIHSLLKLLFNNNNFSYETFSLRLIR